MDTDINLNPTILAQTFPLPSSFCVEDQNLEILPN